MVKNSLAAAVMVLAMAFVPTGADSKTADPPLVAVTIKPIHGLVAAITAGAGSAELLFDGATSPHASALRPSQARALARADVVVWVGPGLESMLVRPLKSVSRDTRVLTLIETEGLVRLANRDGGLSLGDHGDDGAHGHDRHGELGFDPHIWLDPDNARVLVAAIAKALAEADPVHGDVYAANAEALDGALAGLDGELAASLARFVDKPFVVFHDAYQYFEARFGLSPIGAVTLSPEMPASARHISDLRAAIAALGRVCVFSEPQFDPKLVRTLIDGTNARSGVLDPLGAGLPAGPDHYFSLMRGLARAMTDCFAD